VSKSASASEGAGAILFMFWDKFFSKTLGNPLPLALTHFLFSNSIIDKYYEKKFKPNPTAIVQKRAYNKAANFKPKGGQRSKNIIGLQRG
jgi:hypothetical protein